MARDLKKLRKIHPKGQGLLEGALSEDTLRAIEEAHDDSAFQLVDSDIETAYCCPRCGFEWSGSPKPNAEKAS